MLPPSTLRAVELVEAGAELVRDADQLPVAQRGCEDDRLALVERSKRDVKVQLFGMKFANALAVCVQSQKSL